MAAYRGIGAFSKLLELLERAGVSSVIHSGHDGRSVAVGVTVAEVADADGRVCAVRGDESACVDGVEAARRRSRCKLGIPEDGRGRCQLASNAQ